MESCSLGALLGDSLGLSSIGVIGPPIFLMIGA